MAVNGHVNGVRGKHDFAALKVNQSRLMENIHDGCEFGAAWRYGEYVLVNLIEDTVLMGFSHPTETGMARLSLNDSDKQVREWFLETAKSIGCKTSVDQMGNVFAVREGKDKTAPPVMMGSHLDTQPTGGRYDGILGVNAGLEVLRVMADNNYETEGSVGVVNWTK